MAGLSCSQQTTSHLFICNVLKSDIHKQKTQNHKKSQIKQQQRLHSMDVDAKQMTINEKKL